MNHLKVLPDKSLENLGVISNKFLCLGINSFLAACRYVHELPYGYNTNRDDLMILLSLERAYSETERNGGS